MTICVIPIVVVCMENYGMGIKEKDKRYFKKCVVKRIKVELTGITPMKPIF